MEVRKGIEEFLNSEYGIDSECLKEGDHLTDNLGLDSLELVELQLECKSLFCVTIKDNEYEGIHTITQLVKFIEDHQK